MLRDRSPYLFPALPLFSFVDRTPITHYKIHRRKCGPITTRRVSHESCGSFTELNYERSPKRKRSYLYLLHITKEWSPDDVASSNVHRASERWGTLSSNCFASIDFSPIYRASITKSLPRRGRERPLHRPWNAISFIDEKIITSQVSQSS